MPHIHEKIDFTGEVFIVHEGKVLLRKHDKYNIWLGVGGHIELDEDPTQAVVRECKEETGLDVVIVGQPLKFKNTKDHDLVPPLFLNRHRINENHEHVTLVYAAISKTGEFRESAEQERSQGIKWVTESELEDPSYALMDNIVHYAQTALRVVKSSYK